MSLALLKTGCVHLGVLTPRGRKLHPDTWTVVAAPSGFYRLAPVKTNRAERRRTASLVVQPKLTTDQPALAGGRRVSVRD